MQNKMAKGKENKETSSDAVEEAVWDDNACVVDLAVDLASVASWGGSEIVDRE